MAGKSAHVLVVSVVVLIALGIIMLFSTSAYHDVGREDVYYDVKRQFLWLVVGGGICLVLASIDYHFWQRSVWLWFGAAVLLLLLCFVPFIAEERNGAFRWISGKSFGLSFLRLQPSELAKLAAILVLAAWFTKYQDKSGTYLRGFVYPLGIAMVLIALIALEIDLGSATLVTLVTFVIMFAAGTKLRLLGAIGTTALGGLALAVYMIPNRLERFMAFMDLESHKLGVGLQQWRSLLALGSGGYDGMGLGAGRQKMLGLPYSHTDFIFPMIGEELGLWFTLLVVFCFLLITMAGFVISVNAPDRFGRLVSIGIVSMIGFQAVINIGVTTAVLPNKGLPLPFVSYGGSNILCCLAGVGILLNIYRQGMQNERLPVLNGRKLTPGEI